jgi:hypothetical protein
VISTGGRYRPKLNCRGGGGGGGGWRLRRWRHRRWWRRRRWRWCIYGLIPLNDEQLLALFFTVLCEKGVLASTEAKKH